MKTHAKILQQRQILIIAFCVTFSLCNIYQARTYFNTQLDDQLPIFRTNASSHVCEFLPWQKAGYPTGNIIHEIDLIGSLVSNDRTKIIGIGGTRMAWSLPNFENKEEIIYKTIS